MLEGQRLSARAVAEAFGGTPNRSGNLHKSGNGHRACDPPKWESEMLEGDRLSLTETVTGPVTLQNSNRKHGGAKALCPK